MVCGGLSIAAVQAGCGGSSDVKDAGPDQTVVDTGAVVDAGPDVVDSGCSVKTDLFTLDFSDASYPADSGLDGSPQVCWGCIKNKCMMSVAECNSNCDCKKAVTDFLSCVQMNGLQTSCAGPLVTFDPNFAFAFGGCALSNCNGPCPIPAFDAGKMEAGVKDAGGG